MTRQPNAVASAPTARPIEPSPTIPTVTSRSSTPSSGCHVRSRWSSRSPGSRRLTARIIIRTCSAIGREKTPRAFVITMPRSRAAGVSARSTPDDAEWTQVRRGARASSRSNASATSQPRSSTSTSSTGPSVSPSTREVHDPGAGRGRADPLEVARPVARRQDRRQGDRGGHAAGPDPGPPSVAASCGHAAPPASSVAPSRRRSWHAARSRPPGRRSRRGAAASPARPRAGPARPGPPAAAIADTNRSPLAYCSSFRSMPGQAHDRPLERRAPGVAPLVEPGADPLDVGHEPARRPRP